MTLRKGKHEQNEEISATGWQCAYIAKCFEDDDVNEKIDDSC
jgi:hypothetical protein